MDNSEFLSWLSTWNKNLKSLAWEKLGDPKKIAVVSVDMVVGFCHKGSLASPEVKSIIPQVVDVFQQAKNYGVKKFLLLQDAHHHEATEFAAYPPHCVKGSDEAETIPELKKLPFANQFTTIEKNSLSPAYKTEFDKILKENPQINIFIIIGNCTDLCIYAMCMHLRLDANASNQHRKIVVPANAVATYDLSVQKAKAIGAFPHPEKLLHPLFLYHMALNAVDVCAKIG